MDDVFEEQSDEEYERQMRDRELRHVEDRMYKVGYREASEGVREEALQKGFDSAFAVGMQAGRHAGKALGAAQCAAALVQSGALPFAEQLDQQLSALEQQATSNFYGPLAANVIQKGLRAANHREGGNASLEDALSEAGKSRSQTVENAVLTAVSAAASSSTVSTSTSNRRR